MVEGPKSRLSECTAVAPQSLTPVMDAWFNVSVVPRRVRAILVAVVVVVTRYPAVMVTLSKHSFVWVEMPERVRTPAVLAIVQVNPNAAVLAMLRVV